MGPSNPDIYILHFTELPQELTPFLKFVGQLFDVSPVKTLDLRYLHLDEVPIDSIKIAIGQKAASFLNKQDFLVCSLPSAQEILQNKAKVHRLLLDFLDRIKSPLKAQTIVCELEDGTEIDIPLQSIQQSDRIIIDKDGIELLDKAIAIFGIGKVKLSVKTISQTNHI